MNHLQKTRTKFILSKSRLLYKVVFGDNEEQLKIIWLTSKLSRIHRKKRNIHYDFLYKGLDVELVNEEAKSVTYSCPKNLQGEVLRIISKS